ncbi:MAG: ABC-type glycerol-3-phosphate transport system permease component [Candidatus Pelagisphaera sp.]|jgi:ABC-type glycerol-3-phosphate transport system permease component
MKRNELVRTAASLSMLAVALVFLYPLFWMFLGSFKANREIFDTSLFWPLTWTGEYFAILFGGEYFSFGRSLLNSIFIALAQGIGATLLAAMAGFVLGVYQFRSRNLWLGVGVLVVLVPVQMMALPLFIWVNSIGLFDNPVGVILPGLVSGLGLLFFTRVFRQIPRELLDVARIEGASEGRIFLTVLPLLKPFLIAFGFAHFILAWHAHVIPLLILHSDTARTLPLSLAALFGSSLNSPQAVLMAGSTLGMIPLLVVFAIAYPQLKSALQEFVAS